MGYPQDPGGRFNSDVHRRVLAHLSTPEDDYGWSEAALLERMRPDVGTDLQDPDELRKVLEELEGDGHAVRHEGDVWQMSQDGFNTLTGSIANEPTLEDARGGGAVPATLGMAGASRLDGGGGPAGVRQEDLPEGATIETQTIGSADVADATAELGGQQ